jgi:hypothetical protein
MTNAPCGARSSHSFRKQKSGESEPALVTTTGRVTPKPMIWL